MVYFCYKSKHTRYNDILHSHTACARRDGGTYFPSFSPAPILTAPNPGGGVLVLALFAAVACVDMDDDDDAFRVGEGRAVVGGGVNGEPSPPPPGRI